MSQSAYLYFVEGSAVPSLTLEELEAQLHRYKEQTEKTGRQLGWDYTAAAFPFFGPLRPR